MFSTQGPALPSLPAPWAPARHSIPAGGLGSIRSSSSVPTVRVLGAPVRVGRTDELRGMRLRKPRTEGESTATDEALLHSPAVPCVLAAALGSGGGCAGSPPAGLCSSDANCAGENGSLEWKIVLIYLAEDDNDLLNNRSNFISIPQLL